MNRKVRSAIFGIGLVALVSTSGACTASSDTVSSLVDLGASTSGSLVQILTKALIDALLNPPLLDLTAPISSQRH